MTFDSGHSWAAEFEAYWSYASTGSRLGGPGRCKDSVVAWYYTVPVRCDCMTAAYACSVAGRHRIGQESLFGPQTTSSRVKGIVVWCCARPVSSHQSCQAGHIMNKILRGGLNLWHPFFLPLFSLTICLCVQDKKDTLRTNTQHTAKHQHDTCKYTTRDQHHPPMRVSRRRQPPPAKLRLQARHRVALLLTAVAPYSTRCHITPCVT